MALLSFQLLYLIQQICHFDVRISPIIFALHSPLYCKNSFDIIFNHLIVKRSFNTVQNKDDLASCVICQKLFKKCIVEIIAARRSIIQINLYMKV